MPYIPVTLNRQPLQAVVDTGATVSLVSSDIVKDYHNQMKPFKYKVTHAGGNHLDIIGYVDVQLFTNEGDTHDQLLVYRKQNERQSIDLLLGMNILETARIDIPDRELIFKELRHASIRLNNDMMQLHIPGNTIYYASVKHQTVKNQVSHGVTTQNTPQEPKQDRTSQQVSTEDSLLQVDDIHTKDIYLKQHVELPANTVSTVSVSINSKCFDERDVVMLENNEPQQGVVMANVVSMVSDNKLTTNIINLTNTKVILKQGSKLGRAYKVVQNIVPSPKLQNESDIVVNQVIDNKDLKPLTTEDIHCGAPEFAEEVVNTLNKFRDTCWLEGEQIGCYTGEPLEINLKDNQVVYQHPYRIPHAQQEQLNVEIQKMLEQNIIAKSGSSYNSPLIIVKKPGGDIRPCIDYRRLNAIIEPMRFPIPRIQELLNMMQNTNFISSIDLVAAYHQCKIAEKDKDKTAFTVNNTKYHFQRIPFGLSLSPAYFARIINLTLYDLLGPEVLCYMDDILLVTSDKETHLIRLEQVMKKLSEVNLKIKTKKCQFFVDETKFLGYKISKHGMKMDENKLEDVKAMPYPSNKKELQSFLGMVNYYRVFVKNFAKSAEDLYELLRKENKFIWTDRHSAAVDDLKNKLTTAPVIKFPDYCKPFHIYTDASLTGMGAVLMQEHEGWLHPIGYVSKTLTPAQRNYSATKREHLALVYALESFRYIILSFPVEVYTDHLPLIGIFQRPTKDACITRWSLLIQEYSIKLNYLPGKENIFADPLSRLTDVTNGCEQVTEELDNKLIERVNWCDTLEDYIPEKVPWDEKLLRKRQAEDTFIKQVKRELSGEPDTRQLSDTFLKKVRIIKNIVFILRVIKRGKLEDTFLVPIIPDSLLETAYRVIHEDTTAGHPGFERTMKAFKRNFYHHKEEAKIKELTTTCVLCTRAKATSKQVNIGRYPIPHRPFHTISSDILGPLPITTSGNKYILVVRDYTTRYTILTPLKQKDSISIIEAFRAVYSHYGSSRILVTDNAQEFLSEQVTKFCAYYNTKKVEIAPYHPESQGLCERLNRETNKLIRMYTNTLLDVDWDEYVGTLQLTINNTFHSSIKESPFFILYGYDSPTITFSNPKRSYDESDLALRQQRLTLIRNHCRENLLHIQKQYTSYTNKNRQPKDIQIGDRVFADLRKFIPPTKLDLPISGPLIVVKKHGKAFVLKDIQSSKSFTVHPDFIIQSPIRNTPFFNVSTETESTQIQNNTAAGSANNNPKPHNYNLRPRR